MPAYELLATVTLRHYVGGHPMPGIFTTPVVVDVEAASFAAADARVRAGELSAALIRAATDACVIEMGVPGTDEMYVYESTRDLRWAPHALRASTEVQTLPTRLWSPRR